MVSTYDCPVCRKAQILDLDRLQVTSICTACSLRAAFLLESPHAVFLPLTALLASSVQTAQGWAICLSSVLTE